MLAFGYKQLAWLTIFFAVLIWSAIHPKDFVTWLLEVSPAIIGLILIAWTYRSFPLTQLLYLLILVHSVILMIGGHYTYAEVPLFDDFKTVFGFERNNYDKVGHFMQGFMPAILTREIFLRLNIVNGKAWMNFIIFSICLAFSAFYELIEWFVAAVSETAAEAFLGTQGYAWDTQSDMGFALIGAISALLLLGKMHDRQLRKYIA
jgi:putative membrane protein